jgi:hypothetical protein
MQNTATGNNGLTLSRIQKMTAMGTELLRQNFERNKQKYESAAKTRDSKRLRYIAGGLFTSLVLFLSGAIVETFTRFVKDSIPEQLKEALCYTSDVIRTNEYPYQFTIILLPVAGDPQGTHREEIAKSLRSTAYDVNVITPCEPLVLAIKGNRQANKRTYSKNVIDLFDRYSADLLVKGELQSNPSVQASPSTQAQQSVFLQGYTKYDVAAQPFLLKGRINPEIRDVAEPLSLENMSSENTIRLSNQEGADEFLTKNIIRSLTANLRDIRCNSPMQLQCAFEKDARPSDTLVSKFAMLFEHDYPGERDELEERDTGLWEAADYYQALNKYEEDMKGTPSVKIGPELLPIILNLIYEQGQGTYLDANSRRRSLFEFADYILSFAKAEGWDMRMTKGLYRLAFAESCRSTAALLQAIALFRPPPDGKSKEHLSNVEQFLSWLWFGRGQALLYAWGDNKNKEVAARELAMAIASLDRTKVDWTNGDLIKDRVERELTLLRSVNEKISLKNAALPDMGILSPVLCPTTISKEKL